MRNLNERYKWTCELLNKLANGIAMPNNIKIEVEIASDDKLNASVQMLKSGHFKILIYSGCINADYRIQKITERYTEDDWLYFEKFNFLNIFEPNSNDTYREKLNHLFGSVMILHILFHECAHICANHVGVSSTNHIEYAKDSKKVGYKYQEREMVADWLATKYLFDLIYQSFIIINDIKSPEHMKTFGQLIILYRLSLSIEFELFDLNHTCQINDYSKLSHPIPAVRLYYSMEAMFEALIDILNNYGLNDEEAVKVGAEVIKGLSFIMLSFIKITDINIDDKSSKNEIYDYYKKLRNVPYEHKHKDEEIYFHLCKYEGINSAELNNDLMKWWRWFYYSNISVPI